MADYSVVEYYSDHSKYRCGYCGSKDTNYSHGMWAHNMTTIDYQDLIDRGWRRSGKYVYKPTMNLTCCPQYPIRCEVANFRLSDSQKKVIKVVNRFLSYGTRQDSAINSHDSRDAAEQRPSKCANDLAGQEAKVPVTHPKETGEGRKEPTVPKRVVTPGVGADPNKPRCQKAKLRRLEKKRLKQRMKGEQINSCSKSEKSQMKSLEERLSDVVDKPKHKLEVKLVRSSPASQEFSRRSKESYEVYRKYQMTIHHESAADCDKHGYKNFLVESPLQDEEQTSAVADGLGSYHQLYLLDGKIIAVAVLDLLPHCVSSVYFYYDPDFSFLSLGTYSALREVALTRQLSVIDPNIRYYYMGFYIHSCPKMRYKGQYDPSYLLCPETYQWCPVKECQAKLDARKYSRFDETDAVDKDKVDDISDVLCLYKRQAMPYSVYQALKGGSNDGDEVAQYASFVGSRCAGRMLLYRN